MQAIFTILPLLGMIGAAVWAVFSFMPALRKNKKAAAAQGRNALTKARLVQGVAACVLAVVMLFVLVFIPASLHQVNTGEIAVVKVWGEAKETKTAGIPSATGSRRNT